MSLKPTRGRTIRFSLRSDGSCADDLKRAAKEGTDRERVDRRPTELDEHRREEQRGPNEADVEQRRGESGCCESLARIQGAHHQRGDPHQEDVRKEQPGERDRGFKQSFVALKAPRVAL